MTLRSVYVELDDERIRRFSGPEPPLTVDASVTAPPGDATLSAPEANAQGIGNGTVNVTVPGDITQDAPPGTVTAIGQTLALELGAHVDVSGYGVTDEWDDMQNGGPANPGGSGMGTLLWRRSFTPNEIGAWSSGPGSPDVGLGVTRSWVSYKGNLGDMINGNMDSQMSTFISTVPTNQEVIVTFRHEPENDGISAATWRDAQKHFHHYMRTNRGSKDIRTAIVLMMYTFDAHSGRTPSDWVPVYESGDDIPSGFAAGDPAFDIFGCDFYDDDSSGDFLKDWDPVVGGNPDGMSGHLDDMIGAVNYWRGQQSLPQDYGFGDLVWAMGEMSTQKSNAEADDWFQRMVYGARDHPSTCECYCWFHNSIWPQYLVPDSVQDWYSLNGPSIYK